MGLVLRIPFKTEISFDLAFDGTSVFCFDKIPAACVFYY